MRDAETVLGIIRNRGLRGLPIEDVYRQMFNPDLYLRAYSRIQRNKGAMTKGITEETVDGMSLKKIRAIIEQIRYERFRWTPVRRTHIPKKNGKMRPLGIPTWTDKLVQEVIRSILEAYYEPQFSSLSHGFRPNKGCHTALQAVKKWNGTKWFVEGDIKGCFDNIDHQILLSILREKIRDNRLLRLISNLLKAGYMENWNYTPTLSGTPQGGIVSPILSNIYLDRLDKFVENTLKTLLTKGKSRKRNPRYVYLINKVYHLRKKGRIEEAKKYRREMQKIPCSLQNDPDYKRIYYVRYADDFLIGLVGSKMEAKGIESILKKFLQDMKLELSEEKTLITHVTTERARFLGYDIKGYFSNTQMDSYIKKRAINGRLGLYIPKDVSDARCNTYMRNGKPEARPQLLQDSDFDIISRYQREYRGFVQYYQLANNIRRLSKLEWVTQTSLLKTLANKHKSQVKKMARKYRGKIITPRGPRKCIQVTVEREGKKPLIAYFGGVPLIRSTENAVIKDGLKDIKPYWSRSELIRRLKASECELCGSRQEVEVHHIRKLTDVDKPGRKKKPRWKHKMASRRRKTLVVCKSCHINIHRGGPTSKR